jgi:hypothetical protein
MPIGRGKIDRFGASGRQLLPIAAGRGVLKPV